MRSILFLAFISLSTSPALAGKAPEPAGAQRPAAPLVKGAEGQGAERRNGHHPAVLLYGRPTVRLAVPNPPVGLELR